MQEIAPIWLENYTGFPRPSDAEALQARWQQWESAIDQLEDTGIREFSRLVSTDAGGKALFDSIFGNSIFLSHNLISDPALACALATGGPDHVVADTLADLGSLHRLGDESRSELMTRLRRAKTAVASAAAAADIGLAPPVMQVTGWLTELASASLQATCSHLLRELHDRGKLRLVNADAPEFESGLIVLGMGKFGAGELNFSSDIDLIILFEDEAPCLDAGTHQRVFSQLARNLVTVMAKRTADGYVFRTDLRLRPDPGTTPPAVSVDRAYRYYLTLGQTWERAAMIKARPVAGDIAAGERFLRTNSGFVWRRSLDFPALSEIQSMKRRINAHKGSGEIAVENHNVKLGRGGIREIEFLTQTRQLIWGGQDRALRGRGTLAMLDRLAAAGRIQVAAATELKLAYEFLRRIEHRVQMIDDQQTHSLPSSAQGIEKLSVFLGYDEADQFRGDLLRQLRIVERHYNSMFERSSAGTRDVTLDFHDSMAKTETIDALRTLGFRDTETVYQHVQAWIQGRVRASHTHRAQQILRENIVPLVRSFADTPDPDVALARFSGLLGRISRSINLFSAMAAESSLMRLVAEIMGSAPRLAEWLTQQPVLLEGLLESDFQQLDFSDEFGLEPDAAEAARRGLVRLFYEREFGLKQVSADLDSHIQAEAGGNTDMQGLLDAQRRWTRNRKFQIGIHMLRGDLLPAQASMPLSSIAESCLKSLLSHVQREFAGLHGEVEGGRFAIIAGGRLGSAEMTLASDLDLIFVYSHAVGATASNGRKPLSPTQYYAKLSRRFLNGVTAPTAEGRLYEVDMRLRPSGKSGPIACSIERFEHYQHNDAWTWEHQALTRARVIYAEGNLGRRLNSIILNVLCTQRNSAELADDIRNMRQRIRDELEDPKNPTIKYRQGGILDAEFIAQFLQLKHAAEFPAILQRDAGSAFAKAGELGILQPSHAQELHRDLLFWRNTQGILLLTAENDHIEEDAASALQRSFGGQGSDFLISSFLDSMQETSERIASRFDSLIQ
ncbi:MAG: hypothetical protein OXF74_00965 [Rhodobacteraceae bacterium]|nr:hypothetical protein [Paracoccaceae bacterium]